MIPLVDLTLDKKTKSLIFAQIANVIERKNYILGESVFKFERDFAKFIGTRFAVGVGNGTDAIRLALRSLGVGRGEKVLTVSFTSPFTVIAILEEGVIPVFVDVDEKTWTIDLSDAERKIDKMTRAIVPVHIFGNPSDMDKVKKLAGIYKLHVIEDACQGHGAAYKNKKVGAIGDVGAFSFYPTKNLGGIGDGGMVVTNSKKIAQKVKLLRHGGQTKRFWHELAGTNSRLDEVQAAILDVKLKHLTHHNKKRKKLAARYKRKLGDLAIEFQQENKFGESSNHLFVIRTKRRNQLKSHLLANGITSDIYYPYPVHKQKAFADYAGGKLPVTEKLTAEVLALPLYPSLTIENQNKVIRVVKEFFKR